MLLNFTHKALNNCFSLIIYIHSFIFKVLQELFDLEKSIAFLKKAIADKESYLKLAQTRLETRTRRPGIELTRDQAMHK